VFPVTQLAKKSSILKKKPFDIPPQVAIVLKLVDEEEDLEVQQPLEAALGPILTAPTPSEESDVEMIEAPLVMKRKLTKRAEATAPELEARNVANFLAAQRK
jgi:hypothetical protein